MAQKAKILKKIGEKDSENSNNSEDKSGENKLIIIKIFYENTENGSEGKNYAKYYKNR